MTKSNNEWVPEIGAVCEALIKFGASEKWRAVEVLKRHPKKTFPQFAVYVQDSQIVTWATEFRAIKTEAEKRREERIDLLAGQIWQLTPALKIESAKILASNLVADNWIKPKPLTDDVIRQIELAHCGGNFHGRRIARAIESYICGEGL